MKNNQALNMTLLCFDPIHYPKMKASCGGFITAVQRNHFRWKTALSIMRTEAYL